MDAQPESSRQVIPVPPDESPTLALDRQPNDQESEREWTSGTILNGQYEILEQVSRGAWGTVWRAWQPRIERPVAIKRLIARDERSQRAARARFEREAKLASKIRDPNAVRIIDYGHDGPTPYLVMEWIDGITLADAIASWNPLPPDLIETIGLRVASALASAHACGIVHRDLKPSNVMMVETNNGLQPIVIDFGLARTFSPDEPTVTRADVVIGTPAYMSPEAIVGQEITPASDLYSLGVILAEATLGSNPFRGKTSAESMTLHLQPLSFTKETLVVHGASPGFADIIMHLLKSSPEDRLSSAERAVREIEGIRAQSPAPTPSKKATRLSRPDPFETTSTRAVIARATKLHSTQSGALFPLAIAGLALFSTALFGLVGARIWSPPTTELSPEPTHSTSSSIDGVGTHSGFRSLSRAAATTSESAQDSGMVGESAQGSPVGVGAITTSIEQEETFSTASSPSEEDRPTPPALAPTDSAYPEGTNNPSKVAQLETATTTPLAPTSESRRETSRSQRSNASKPSEAAPSTLVITSLPAAEIVIDGKSYGVRTNVVLRDLLQREVHVSAIFDGKRESRSIRLLPGERNVTGFRFETLALDSQASRP